VGSLENSVDEMAEDVARGVTRAAARACILASAATAIPLWLFSRLTPYHFLFSASTPLSRFGTIINVCAFTGYLLAAAAIPTYLVYLYAIGYASGAATVIPTLGIVSMAVIHFCYGVMGYGPPNLTSRIIGVLLLLPVAIRLIVPVRRFFRARPLSFVPVAYAIGISLAILALFAYASPELMPVSITDNLGHNKTVYIPMPGDDFSFYTTESLLEFGFWRWLAAGVGALTYFAAALTWQNLQKPPAPEPKAE
jgi:hypothetical protein